MLYRTGFLKDTPRGCNFYRIKYLPLFQYRNQLLKSLDERCINGEQINFDNENSQINNGEPKLILERKIFDLVILKFTCSSFYDINSILLKIYIR